MGILIGIAGSLAMHCAVPVVEYDVIYKSCAGKDFWKGVFKNSIKVPARAGIIAHKVPLRLS